MPRAIPITRITRDSVHWLAEDVGAFLEYSCIAQPNPLFAPSLDAVWNHVLCPFFAGSPAGDSSHGEFLENYAPHRNVMAHLIRNGRLAVRVHDVCSAIAYVLSTLVEHISPKKYLMLAGVFAHFCRLVNPCQRPEMIHIFWPAGSNPIILINDASVHIHDPAGGYQKVTLSFALKGNARSFKPDGECSQLIPVIWSMWSLSDGQPLQFFSASFASLRSALELYKEGGRSATFKGAARPVCDTCQNLLSGIGISCKDLGVDKFKLDESSSHSSDDSARRRSSLSGGDISPTGRPLYAAADPNFYSGVSFSPPNTRASIEPPRSRRYSHATIPGVYYPIAPPSPTDFRPYAPPYQAQMPPQPQAQPPVIPAQMMSIGYRPYNGGGYVHGYSPYFAQSVSPPPLPLQRARSRRPKQSWSGSDYDKEGLLIDVRT